MQGSALDDFTGYTVLFVYSLCMRPFHVFPRILITMAMSAGDLSPAAEILNRLSMNILLAQKVALTNKHKASKSPLLLQICT